MVTQHKTWELIKAHAGRAELIINGGARLRLQLEPAVDEHVQAPVRGAAPPGHGHGRHRRRRVRAPCDRPRGAHGGGAGVPRRHGACGVGMGLLPGDQPRRAAGAAARAARRTVGRVPAALPGEGDREAARLLAGELPVGNADGQVPGAAVVVGGLSHPNDDAQAQHEHQGQGGDRGGVEGDVRAGAEAGRDPDERAAGRRRGRDDGDDAGGDVLPAAEPVPTVRHGHGGLRAVPAHGQRLAHHRAPAAGHRRRPPAAQGRQVGGREAQPQHPHRQRRRPPAGVEQRCVQERGAQGDGQRHAGALLHGLLPLPLLPHAHHPKQQPCPRRRCPLPELHLRRVQEADHGGRQEHRPQDWTAPLSNPIDRST